MSMIQFRDICDLHPNFSGPEIWLEISSGQTILNLYLSGSSVRVFVGRRGLKLPDDSRRQFA
jgi:hypothetical protein